MTSTLDLLARVFVLLSDHRHMHVQNDSFLAASNDNRSVLLLLCICYLKLLINKVPYYGMLLSANTVPIYKKGN